MKSTNFYINILLGSVILFFIFIMVLSEVREGQAPFSLAQMGRSETRVAAPAEPEEKGTDNDADTLLKLLREEKTKARQLSSNYDGKLRELEKKIASLEQQLSQSQEKEQKTRDDMFQLIDSQTPRIGELEAKLTQSNEEILSRDQELLKTRKILKSIRSDYENEKLKSKELADNLEQKKSELIRVKRALTQSKRNITAKTRELAISKGIINDERRRNEALSKQLSATAAVTRPPSRLTE